MGPHVWGVIVLCSLVLCFGLLYIYILLFHRIIIYFFNNLFSLSLGILGVLGLNRLPRLYVLIVFVDCVFICWRSVGYFSIRVLCSWRLFLWVHTFGVWLCFVPWSCVLGFFLFCYIACTYAWSAQASFCFCFFNVFFLCAWVALAFLDWIQLSRRAAWFLSRLCRRYVLIVFVDCVFFVSGVWVPFIGGGCDCVYFFIKFFFSFFLCVSMAL